MIKTLFFSVFEISLSTSFIILLLVILAPFLNKRYAAKRKYWIWIILAIRLLLPFGKTKSEPLVVINIPEQITSPLMSHGTSESERHFLTKVQMPRMSVDITLLDFAAFVWLLGVLTMLSIHGLSYVHFKRQVIQKGVFVEDDSILCRLQQLMEELHIRRKIVVIKYSQATSPMIVGFVHPILVIPEETYRREELYFILKHELLHLKRHDIYFKLLLLAVNALHWFNPVVWFMRKEATIDMELSCDESVVLGMNLEARKAYTKTLLSALYRQCAQGISLTTQFYGGKQEMKKRFTNILVGTKKKNGFSLMVCAILLTLALGSLVGCSIKETTSDEKGIVYTDVGALRVRGEADKDSQVISLLPDGAEVTILGEKNEFYRILLEEADNTAEGYVRKEFIYVD